MKQKLALILLAGLLVTACGCTGTASNSPSGEPGSAVETTAPAETAEVTETPAAGETEAPQETAAPAETEHPAESQEPQSPQPETATGTHSPEESWAVVQEYGFDGDGYSVLSFELDPGTVQDCGDYYSVEATFGKAIYVPADPQPGESVTVTRNEMTGETLTLTVGEDGVYYDSDGMDYYTVSDEASPTGEAALYWFSDDRVDDLFYQGTLYINKKATWGVAIIGEYRQLELEDITGECPWFNGVRFDESGRVTDLVFFGD